MCTLHTVHGPVDDRSLDGSTVDGLVRPRRLQHLQRYVAAVALEPRGGGRINPMLCGGRYSQGLVVTGGHGWPSGKQTPNSGTGNALLYQLISRVFTASIHPRISLINSSESTNTHFFMCMCLI